MLNVRFIMEVTVRLLRGFHGLFHRYHCLSWCSSQVHFISISLDQRYELMVSLDLVGRLWRKVWERWDPNLFLSQAKL